MLSRNPPLDAYLEATDVIDWRHSEVQALAKTLAQDASDPQEVAKRCFEWVRDEIKHSADFHLNPVTCSASQILQERTGFCYAKSHLLAALLRANGIPAGFCYQRLSIDGEGPPFCLHGLNAIHLPEIGWYRVDARGNRPGLATAFEPPQERLAFQPQIVGEATFAKIWASPLSVVVTALQHCKTYEELLANLPDLEAA
jgi:transglutaminase-like putative cysteine protease